jgi:hypothetical protein
LEFTRKSKRALYHIISEPNSWWFLFFKAKGVVIIPTCYRKKNQSKISYFCYQKPSKLRVYSTLWYVPCETPPLSLAFPLHYKKTCLGQLFLHSSSISLDKFLNIAKENPGWLSCSNPACFSRCFCWYLLTIQQQKLQKSPRVSTSTVPSAMVPVMLENLPASATGSEENGYLILNILSTTQIVPS